MPASLGSLQESGPSVLAEGCVTGSACCCIVESRTAVEGGISPELPAQPEHL